MSVFVRWVFVVAEKTQFKMHNYTEPGLKEEKPKYLRWHPVVPDTGTFRGDDLQSLNERTMYFLHESALSLNTVGNIETCQAGNLGSSQKNKGT